MGNGYEDILMVCLDDLLIIRNTVPIYRFVETYELPLSTVSVSDELGDAIGSSSGSYTSLAYLGKVFFFKKKITYHQ